ncbi:hypothetical protein TNCV_1303951 [Trichonephila clavipes]|nr:hypothetical protein TNCV_1303951 [Trichonephila clavipes]
MVNPDDPNQDNGTKLLNYCIVIDSGEVTLTTSSPDMMLIDEEMYTVQARKKESCTWWLIDPSQVQELMLITTSFESDRFFFFSDAFLLHRQLRETRSFDITRHDADRRRTVRSPSLEERILYLVADRPESSTRAVAHHGSEDDISDGDHNLSLRCFPTDFLCPLQGLKMGAVALLPYIRLVGGVGFLKVKNCRGDGRRQELAIFRCARVRRERGYPVHKKKPTFQLCDTKTSQQ